MKDDLEERSKRFTEMLGKVAENVKKRKAMIRNKRKGYETKGR